MSKNAIIYSRVSTEEQAKSSKTSLPEQIKECHKYASRNDLNIVAEITDEFSGGTLERPGFLELRSLLTDGKAQAVIVTERTRLSRDSADLMYLRKQWGRAGIEIHFCDTGKITYDYAGIILDSTFAGVSEGERYIIRERTMKGRVRKAEKNNGNNGRPVMSGRPPFGYDKVGFREEAKLVFNKDQKRIVQDIYKWYIHGDGVNGPLTLNAIAKKLDALEPPPAYKNQKSKCWHSSIIRRILANEVYIGRLYYRKIRVEWGKKIPQPKENWIKIDVPELAFIDQSVYDAAQVRAKRNKERAKRNRKHQYLLTGHLQCGSCGYAAVGIKYPSTKGGFNIYYKCGTYAKKHVSCVCAKIHTPTWKIDNAVWNWIVWLLSDDENLKTGIKELIEKRESELTPKLEKLESIQDLIVEAKKMIARLTTELSMNDDEIVLAAIREQLTTLSKNRQSLDRERGNLEAELSQLVITEDMEEQIKALAASVRDKLPGASYEAKRRILNMLDVKVILYIEN